MSFLLRIFGKKRSQMSEASLVLLGSSGAGKTTFVKFLETGIPVEEEVRTTLGIDIRANPVKLDNWAFIVIDVGGQSIYEKTFWSLGVGQADAVIYVIDGTIRPDNSSFSHNLKQFQYMLNLVESEIPLLVLVNKQDLTRLNPLTVEETFDVFGMSSLEGRSINLLPTSAKYGNGVETAMQWLMEKLEEVS